MRQSKVQSRVQRVWLWERRPFMEAKNTPFFGSELRKLDTEGRKSWCKISDRQWVGRRATDEEKNLQSQNKTKATLPLKATMGVQKVSEDFLHQQLAESPSKNSPLHSLSRGTHLQVRYSPGLIHLQHVLSRVSRGSRSEAAHESHAWEWAFLRRMPQELQNVVRDGGTFCATQFRWTSHVPSMQLQEFEEGRVAHPHQLRPPQEVCLLLWNVR